MCFLHSEYLRNFNFSTFHIDAIEIKTQHLPGVSTFFISSKTLGSLPFNSATSFRNLSSQTT